MSIGARSVLAQPEANRRSNTQAVAKGKTAISTIRVAQIKIYPQKGDLEANHQKLMDILKNIEKSEHVDVVVTPEGFLDGYVSTEKSVTKEDMVKYAIDPLASEYTRAASDWAGRNKAWLIYGCARKTTEGVYNTALIYNRSSLLVGMYDKLHLQEHDLKYAPGKHLDVYKL